MDKSVYKKSGSYHLLLFVEKLIKIRIGKFGLFTFPAGYYIYTGSGMNNVEKRVSRHLKNNKILRWHIDYLTSHKLVHIIHVTCLFSVSKDECARNQFISTQAGAQIIVPKFGASDCDRGCASHLFYFSSKPDFINY